MKSLLRLIGALSLLIEEFVEVGGVRLLVEYLRSGKSRADAQAQLALAELLEMRDVDGVASAWDDWDDELQRAGVSSRPSGEDRGEPQF